MKDLLRAANSMPDFTKAANVILIETSKHLIEEQKRTLNASGSIEWKQSIRDLPPVPTILIANELLDVLPFRQYVKAGKNWHERCVGLEDAHKLIWVLSPNCIRAEELPDGHENEPDGSVFEISTAREAFVHLAANQIKNHGGAALFIDYGHIKTAFGDTFQAIKQQAYVDPLAFPSEADLTSHVDFQPLAKIAAEAQTHVFKVLTQGEFLLKLGLLQRAGALGHNKSSEIQKEIQLAVDRLAQPHQMGDLFKCFAFSAEKMCLPAFE